jgi:RHS repeat-associated protein
MFERIRRLLTSVIRVITARTPVTPAAVRPVAVALVLAAIAMGCAVPERATAQATTLCIEYGGQNQNECAPRTTGTVWYDTRNANVPGTFSTESGLHDAVWGWLNGVGNYCSLSVQLPPYTWSAPTVSSTEATQLSSILYSEVYPSSGGYPCTSQTAPGVNVGVNKHTPLSCPTEFSNEGTDTTVDYPFGYCYRPLPPPCPEISPAEQAGSKTICTKVGDPIDVTVGNLVEAEKDYGGGGTGLPFERTYNTFGGINSPGAQLSVQTLGPQWFHNYSKALWTYHGGSGVRVSRADGSAVWFTLSNGAYVSYGGTPGILTQLPSGGGWNYQTGKDDVEHFDTNGVLQTVTARDGKVTTLAYSTSSTPTTIAPGPGFLIGVTNSFGAALSFTYDSNWHLVTMTDPAGGVYSYAYANGMLTSVTYPDTASRSYVYNEPAYTQSTSIPTALTGIVDETGTRFANFGYKPSGLSTGLAVMSEHAGGADHISVNFGNGRTSVTDAFSTQRSYAYTTYAGYLRVANISNPCSSCSGGSELAQYDANGNVSVYTDLNGHETKFAYDLTRNIQTSRTEGLSQYGGRTGSTRTITTSWNSSYRLPQAVSVYAGTTATGTPLRTTTFGYDGSGSVLTKTVTDPVTSASRTWTYTYDSYGHILTALGPRTDVTDKTVYTYYSCTGGYQCGQLNTVTDSVGNVTAYNTYNAHGQPLTITDPNGVVTTLAYDARARIVSRQVGSETTTFAYWPTGLLKRVTLPDGAYVQYAYDAAHRLNQITGGPGNKIGYTIDAMGNWTAQSAYDPNSVLSRTSTRVIDALNQVYEEIGSANTSAVTTTYGYDSKGQPLTINAPLNRNTYIAYDELDRLNQVTDPANGGTSYSYDVNDSLTQVTDPRNLVTSYQYNGFGDVTQLTSPDTGVTAYSYDSGGNLKTATDARSAVSTYTYDARNRVTSVSYKVGSTTDQTISFGYDAGTNGKGRLTSASDANHSMIWTYDGLGRVTSKGQTVAGVTETIGYAYTNADLTTLTTPSGQTVTYGYTNKQITSISINGSTLLSSVSYEPFGPVRGWTWGNAATEVRTHNTDGNPSTISAIESSSYSYDNAFRITGISNSSNSALSWTYGYDLLDRLTSTSETGATYGWTYDANGNRKSQTGTVAATFSPSTTSNRLNSITGTPARTYAYDNAGNTLTYGGNTFAYYNSGRMKTATVGSSTTTYVYNALGQRIEKSGGPAGTVLTVYDEAGHIVGEYTSTGSLIEETVWMGDTPVATIQPSGSSVAVYYIHADHLNAPRMITRSSDNTILWRWDTDPFGTAAPNQNPSGVGTFVYNVRYPGQYFDAETGLNYNYYRDLDPQTGRYVESDPIGLYGGINTYAYAASRPTSNVDARGLSAADVAAILQLVKNWNAEQTAQGWRIDPGWRNDSCYWSRKLGLHDPQCKKDRDYSGCGEQAETLLKHIKASIANGTLKLDDRWMFLSETSLLHFWVGAYSANPSDPDLTLDPFHNSFGPR